MKIASNKLKAKVAISVIVTGAMLCIAFVKFNKTDENIIPKNRVAPPFKNVDVDYTFYNINAQENAQLNYKTGSTINIPANAFLDKNGENITGKVDIKYREFHDPAEFFVSGIPMTYDSAGTQYHFESAGMLEILAYQNGIPVYIDPDKKIIVEMASEQKEDKYNIYQFDSIAGNWKYIYKDNASGKASPDNSNAVALTPAKIPVTVSLLDKKGSEKAVKPQLANKDNYQFNLEVDKSEFPELSVYKDVQFEVKNGEPDFKMGYCSIQWNDLSLKKSRNAGSYLMTLINGREEHTFEVSPVFAGSSYETAYSEYVSLLKTRKTKEVLTKKSNDSLYVVLEKERNFQNILAKTSQANAAANFETQELVKRVFVISGFGIWNSDCPAMLPKGEQFAAKYVDSTGKKISFPTVYLVEKGRNAMFSIYSNARLSYDPSKDNIIWGVTADNKLAVFTKESFKKLKKTNDSCTVEMKIIDREITKAYEVRELLDI